MPRARSVAIALSAAALAVPSAAFGQGSSGAGDDQYEDPFENGGNNSSQTTTGSQTSGGSTLTQDPNLGGSPTTGTTTTSPTTTPTTTTALPNTGSDPRLIILAGLALLLSGLGLRLRTADEIF